MDYVENRMAQGQFPITYLLASANTPQKPPSRPPQKCKPSKLTLSRQAQLILHSQTIATPINFILLSLFVLILYTQLKPKPKVALPSPPPPVVFRTFTPPTLLPYNGTNNMPVYLAVRGRVFDVSSGRNFYGPGGPYENFAGRDASRGLACGSFDEEMLTKDLQAPLDKLEGLGPDEMEALQGWEERFSEKYLVVGKLVAVEDEGKE
jgi:membrane-associated progesterone receptor component